MNPQTLRFLAEEARDAAQRRPLPTVELGADELLALLDERERLLTILNRIANNDDATLDGYAAFAERTARDAIHDAIR